jgi:hypothetical protein
MKMNAAQKRLIYLPILNDLILSHREFQEFLDLVTSSNQRFEDTDALIEIRQFNINCISKYSDLIAKQAVNLLPLTLKNESFYSVVNDNEVMWEINTRLGRFMPIYNKALKSKKLNSLIRLIIGQNLEKIIEIRENLLHPISLREINTIG